MVRSRRILEVVEAQRLFANAMRMGEYLLERLQTLAVRHDAVGDVRGRGLMCAFSLPTAEERDHLVQRLWADERVILLPSGENSVRFRPPLIVSAEEIDAAVAAVSRVLALR